MTQDERWVLEEKYGVATVKDLRGLSLSEFEADKRRLALGEPAAYVIGWQPFLGLKIYLDSRPLIPRPETERWTQELLTHVGHVGHPMSHMRILDLCAGSGAIGCAALKQLPGAEVWFGEIDPAHEATIQKNIREIYGAEGMIYHTLRTHAHVGIGDLFDPFPNMQFDVVACNPPYVPEGRALPTSVARYEPREALYAGADGLELIRRIARELPARLAPNGVAWIECDSEHAEEARAAFGGAGLAARLMHDQYGRPRVITVSFGQ